MLAEDGEVGALVGIVVVVVVGAVGVGVGVVGLVRVCCCGGRVGLGWGAGGEGGVPEGVGLEGELVVGAKRGGRGEGGTDGGWRVGSEESIVGSCWRDSCAGWWVWLSVW